MQQNPLQDSAPSPVGALHLVISRMRPDATADATQEAVRLAEALTTAPGAAAVLIGEGEALIVVTLLHSPAALDGFAASGPHMSFVVRGLSAVTDGVWTAAAATAADTDTDALIGLLPSSPLAARSPTSPTSPASPSEGEAAASLPAIWVCALRDDASLFDWQVRGLLKRLTALPGVVWCGPTIEDRDEHRLAAVALVPPLLRADFEEALAELLAADATLPSLLRTAEAPIARVLRP